MTATAYQLLDEELGAQLEKTARFISAAFHVHSVESHDWGKDGEPTLNDAAQFEGDAGQDAFLDKLAGAGLELVVITDHMKCTYACELAGRAQGRSDITVFPGMEVSCRTEPGHGARIHFLVAFKPGTTPDVIARIFHGQEDLAGEAKRNGSEEIVVRNLTDFRKAVESSGGILIFAHVDEQSRGHRSYVRRMIGETVEMLAIDSKGKETEQGISDMYKDFLVDGAPTAVEVRGSEDSPHYVDFATSDGRRHTVACVAQSDFHTVESFSTPECFTHVKVSRAEFDCVKDALKFRDTRVRFADELPSSPTPRLRGLRLQSPGKEGLFEDLTIAFNENLNCVIGARGCGKSTVVEALRYVLGQRSLLSNAPTGGGADNSFAGLALATQEANLAGTQIELIYETEGERHLLAATHDPDSDCTTKALTLDGTDCHVAAEAISTAYPALIFSWGELETLGRDPRLQRVVVDRLSDQLPEQVGRLDALEAGLQSNREAIEASMAALERILAEEGGLLRRYSELKGKFERMNTDEVAGLFKSLDTARGRVQTLEALEARLAELLSSLEGVDASVPLAVITELPDELAQWWASELASEFDLDGLQAGVEAGVSTLAGEIEARRTKLTSRIEEQRKLRDETEESLRQQTQADATASIQSQQREEARRRFEDVSALRERYLLAYAELGQRLADRAELLGALAVGREKIAATRREVAAELTAELAEIGSDGPLVSIAVDQGADRKQLEKFLGSGFLNPERAGQWKHRRSPSALPAVCRPRSPGRSSIDHHSNSSAPVRRESPRHRPSAWSRRSSPSSTTPTPMSPSSTRRWPNCSCSRSSSSMTMSASSPTANRSTNSRPAVAPARCCP